MQVRSAAFLVAMAAAACFVNALHGVHPSVLRQQGSVDLVVVLSETTESVLEGIQESEYYRISCSNDRIFGLNCTKPQYLSLMCTTPDS